MKHVVYDNDYLKYRNVHCIIDMQEGYTSDQKRANASTHNRSFFLHVYQTTNIEVLDNSIAKFFFSGELFLRNAGSHKLCFVVQTKFRFV